MELIAIEEEETAKSSCFADYCVIYDQLFS